MSEYLKNFILSNKNWEEILTNPPYSIKIQRKNGFILFKYNQLYSDFSLPEVKEARGIMFKEDTWECVCRAFDKFGNYGEDYVPELDWENNVSVQEKIDGSLIKIWCYNDKWHISTNGNIDAYETDTGNIKIKNFGELFELALKRYGYNSFEFFTKTISPNFTHIFELATPYNRVVIPYDECKIYYLGSRSKITGKEEWNPEDWDEFDLPKIYNLKSLNDVIKSAEQLPWDEEGYVCVDKDFNRCKIKSLKYIMAHYARNNNNISLKALIDIILKKEINEFLIYASDYKEEIFNIAKDMTTIKDIFNTVYDKIPIDIKTKDRKNYIKYITTTFTKPTEQMAYDFVFKNYKQFISVEQYTKKWDKHKWEKIIKQYRENKAIY